MDVQNPLALREDPFGPANEVTGTGISPSLLTACDDLLASIREREPLTVVVGRAGFGKTLLLSIVEHRCTDEGLKVLRIARGDMAHMAIGTDADLLLIDEADSLIDSTLAALAPGTEGAAAPMMVFACVRPRLHRIPGGVRPALIELLPLDAADSRAFLQGRMAAIGRPDLFEPEALDAIVRAGHGSPRLLRVLAGTALSQALNDGATRIGRDHAEDAIELQHDLQQNAAPFEPEPEAVEEVSPALHAVAPLPQSVMHRCRPDRRKRDLVPLAASVALAALVLPNLMPFDGGEEVADAPNSAIAAGTPPAIARVATPFSVSAAHATPNWLVRPAPQGAVLTAASAAPPPLLATAAVQPVRNIIRPAQLPARALVQEAHSAFPPAELRPPEVVAAPARTLVVDVLAAIRPQAPAFAAARREERQASVQTGTAAIAVPLAPAVASDVVVKPVELASVAGSGKTVVETAREVSASVERASDTREVASQAVAAKEAADQARSAKHAAENSKEARATADRASAAKQIAEQAAATKDAAEQGRATKEMAERAKEAKESSDRARAAKESAEKAKEAREAREAADQARASKEAADEAKAARKAADEAKAVKEAAEQAKSAKEAVEQAKAAKEAAEKAKEAKEAAEQAKAAKDAADQAQSAKEAAEQARVAKEAAEQAKAVKEAAEQAKAVKEAAEQARGAKEAAEQAKAAKEAAEQAKAVKETVEQAKAVKEAAEQAKAAKEAAQNAKDAKDAAREAKEAKDAARDAKEAAKAAKDASKGGKGG